MTTGTRILALGLTFAAALCGCARVNVHSEQIRGVAYVDVSEVMKHHPLYGQLQQLNDAIAAINLQSTLPRAPLSAAQIAEQTKVLQQEMKAAQGRASATIAQLRTKYQEEERQADISVLQAAHIDPTAAGIGQQMSNVSQQQAQQAFKQAGKDYAAYQKSVITQSNDAVRAISNQLRAEVQQKLRARAEEYQQDESNLALQLAQRDAQQRLALKTKLNDLALDPASRKQTEDQLNAIDNNENTQVNGLRSQDQKKLADYQRQLGKQANAQMQKQLTAVRDQTNAKLNEKRNQVNNQLRRLAAPVPTVSIPPAVAQKLQQIHGDFAQKFQADAQQAVSEYTSTQNDLNAEYQQLHGADVGATGAAAQELNDLQKRHDALQNQMQDQIRSEAQRIAKEDGFTVVFDGVMTASGGYDLTNDLIKDVESLHE
jgi:hypothetical protein